MALAHWHQSPKRKWNFRKGEVPGRLLRRDHRGLNGTFLFILFFHATPADYAPVEDFSYTGRAHFSALLTRCKKAVKSTLFVKPKKQTYYDGHKHKNKGYHDRRGHYGPAG
jgi:hypothetical protein